MKNSQSSVLFLNLYAFSLTGGIEKVCVNFIRVLNQLFDKEKWCSLSLYDDIKDVNSHPLSSKNVQAFKGNKFVFFIKSLLLSLQKNTIILSHINLLVIAKISSFIRPRNRFILVAHGIEVWNDLPKWKLDFIKEKVEIWAVSSFTKKTLMQKHQIPAHYIKVLNNSLESNFEIPTTLPKPAGIAKYHHLDTKKPILFTLTRMSSTEKYKGYDNVIKALGKLKKEHKTLQYLLAGKADELERKRIDELIAANDLTNEVRVVGYLPETQLRDYYLTSDAFIMPSKGEGFGIVFIEAAAHGCQVIAGNKDGSTDALLNGKLGQLVDPDNVDAIAAAIEQAINNKNHDPQRQQQLTVEHFGFETYKNKVAQLLAATTLHA
jgi:glycosyltransferase involved in cell wall biosynthesis